MDSEEAKSVLTRELERYRATPYAELKPLLDDTAHIETTGPSGTNYQVEIYAVWDDKPNGNLRVFGAIDDYSGWCAFMPLTDCFILRPDGTFVG